MLQDHFRKVCTPNYVNVFRDRGGVIGVVEFDTPEDLARAIRKLDDTEFRNPFERAYIRVYDDSDAKRGGGRRCRALMPLSVVPQCKLRPETQHGVKYFFGFI
jgi:arginine/serine-rich splicing factor 1/9